MLHANNFAELADLDVLASFTGLTHLVLSENPVTRKEVCMVGFVCLVVWVWEVWRFDWRGLTGVFTSALSNLGCLEVSFGTLFRL